MYCKIRDFIEDWKAEAVSTIKVFSIITEQVKSNKVSENVRSLERLAWHITQTTSEMPYQAGILDSDPIDSMPIPGKITEIIAQYQNNSDQLIKSVTEKWSDADLDDTIDIYGQKWQRKRVLSVLVKHQVHHRAQMTILMRLAGLKVPGIYGPSKEEWVNYGMEAQP